jgi:hypothetical protein
VPTDEHDREISEDPRSASAREHRVMRLLTAAMLYEKQGRRHRSPAVPRTLGLGQTRGFLQWTTSGSRGLYFVPSPAWRRPPWIGVNR